MADFTKVGISMLNMADIMEFLRMKKFLAEDDKATDVYNVHGVESERIAIADDTGNPDIIDRSTVRNANHLGEQPPEYYLPASAGDKIVLDTTNIKNTFAQEVANLRDEVYQLRNELATKGITARITPYDGFYDTFLNNTHLHNTEQVGAAIEDSTGPNAQYYIKVLDTLYEDIKVGDHLFIVDTEDNLSAIMTVASKGADNETINFTSATGFDIVKDKTVIYKTKGNIVDGAFVFGEIAPMKPGKKEFYVGLADDTYHQDLILNESNAGYGYTFRIPREYTDADVGVYLKDISIQVQVQGDPEPLTAYLIDSRDVELFKNPIQAEEDGIIIAKSNPLKVNSAVGKLHTEYFSFFDASAADVYRKNGTGNNNAYPLLTPKDENGHLFRYCLIIAAGEMDPALDSYTIRFLQHRTETGYVDLQLNNITYKYSQATSNSITTGLKTDDIINAYDLYYGVTLVKPVTESFTAYPNGIYSANFNTKDEFCSHARLTMRINREGLYHVKEKTGAFSDGDTFIIDHDENGYDIDFSNYRNAAGNSKPFILDTSMVHLSAVDNQRVTIEKGCYANASNPIFYPVGYEISIKARRKYWDPNTCSMVKTEFQRFKMPLVAVMPDGHKPNKSLSDRLVFEADLRTENGELQQFNDFEIEIFWTKSCANNNIDASASVTADESMSRKLAGAIHSISVSVTKAL